MLVNPKKRRTAKQKAATRKLVAFNRRRQRGSVSVPRPRKRGRSITRSRTVKKSVTRRRNPVRRTGMANRMIKTATNGAFGSLGAITGSIVGNYLPLPANLKIGNMGMVVNALIGIATGYTVSNFMDRKIGEEMAQGAVTVALHGTMKNMLGTMMPGLALSDDLLGYEAYNGLLGHDDYDDDLSAYVEGGNMMNAYDDNLSYSGAGYTGENPDPFDSI